MNNLFISCKESRIENNRSFYGCFSIGAFDAAQSLTIANALRRTLLSECSGLSIISVIIENVSHEYSTLPGMRESVLDLLLNLKEIVLKKNNNSLPAYFSNQTKKFNLDFDQKVNLISKQINCESSSFFKPVIGYLKVKGPGIIRAKDLKLPSFIQCVDPEQYIATLAEDGFLSMKILITEGKGYLIQKNNSFIDYNLVKKRSNFLNELSYQTLKSKKLLKNKPQQEILGNETFSNILTEEINNTSLVNSDFAFKESSYSEDKQNKILTIRNKNNLSKMLKQKNFHESKALNLDCIFNPVTKVSYIIQDFDNQVVNDFYDNMTFINQISSLIESSHFLNKNFPYLTKEISLNKKSVLDFVEIYTKSEIKEICNYLHPLKKQNSLHHIILEIWTNGSIHPREALLFGLQNLSTTFLNLQLLL